MRKSATAILTSFFILIAVLSASPLAAVGPGTIDGRAFNDLNVNGVDDGELGVANVTVTAFDAANAPVATALTDGNGNYSLTGLTDGVPYRIEFTDLPANHEPTFATGGASSQSTVQFATPETAGVSLGLHVPCGSVDDAALVNTYDAVTTCTAFSETDSVLGLGTLRDHTYAPGTQTPPMYDDPAWSWANLGTIYFSEYDDAGNIYLPASRFGKGVFDTPGLIGYGSGGPGAIYKIDAVTGAVSIFATLPQPSGGTIGPYPPTQNPNEATDYFVEPGLGGITFDARTDVTYVVNMDDGGIYALDASGAIVSTHVPLLGTSTATFDDGVPVTFDNIPFGLDINPVDGRLYYTVHNAADLVVRSVALDPVTGAILPATDIVEIQNPHAVRQGDFGSAHDVIADIDFSIDGQMALGSFTTGEPDFNDNGGLYYNTGIAELYNHTSFNKLFVGSSPGGWTQTVDTTVGQERYNNVANGTATGGVAWNQTPGDPNVPNTLWMTGGDFFGEDSNWGVIGYDPTTLATDIPAIDEEDSTSYYQFLFPVQNGRDPKGTGGDIDVFGCIAHIEIGNVLWIDTDQDGQQSPGEAFVAGVEIGLYDSTGSLIATAVTDANGNYVFSSAPGTSTGSAQYGLALAPNTTYTVGVLDSNFAAGGPLEGYVPTVANVEGSANDQDDNSDSDGVPLTGIPGVSWGADYTTGNLGENNHTIDFGVFSSFYDLSLIKTLATGQATTVNIGDDVTFTITVTNQGTITANTFTITDFLPTGTTLNDTDWTNNADGTATYTHTGALNPGDSEPIDITLTVNTAGDLVNWAEISNDDGDDIDSQPDTNQTNDNQPNDVANATNNAQDNAGGDEDDHDLAGVTVRSSTPTTTTTPPRIIAFTGTSSIVPLMVALLLMISGLALLRKAHQQRENARTN